ncbi:MAG: phosphate acetyltransferase [Clostridia bacterium]|nr:phosphate acetyltransferase [Clostridia bacterium]
MFKTQSILDKIVLKAKGIDKRIVLPEGEDPRVIEAIISATKLELGRLIVLGNEVEIYSKLPKNVSEKIIVLNPKTSLRDCEIYADKLYALRKNKGLTLEQARIEVLKPMVFATMMLYAGDADGIVAGLKLKTGDVVRPAFQIIKAEEGVNKISSAMIMQMPKNSSFGENGVLVFADCGIIPEPTSEDLADIAISSAKTAETLCGIKPRVALLSFSTKSQENTGYESVERVKSAVKIIKSKMPNLIVDGELQADSAIVPSVAKAKCPNSILGGNANVLVFPDLNSANIAYKLVQRIANIEAVGPILQGLNKPVNDLSRGATANELVRAIAITILQASK